MKNLSILFFSLSFFLYNCSDKPSEEKKNVEEATISSPEKEKTISFSPEDQAILDFISTEPEGWLYEEAKENSKDYRFKLVKNSKGHYIINDADVILGVSEEGNVNVMDYELFLKGEEQPGVYVCYQFSKLHEDTIEILYYDQCARLSAAEKYFRPRLFSENKADPDAFIKKYGIGVFVFNLEDRRVAFYDGRGPSDIDDYPSAEISKEEYSLSEDKDRKVFQEYPEYDILHAIAVDSSSGFGMFLVKYSNNQNYWVGKYEGKFYTWEDYLKNKVLSVMFNESKNPIRSAPDDAAPVIKTNEGYGSSVKKVEGDWVLLGEDECEGFTNDKEMWVRWRKNGELLVNFAFVC